MTITESPFHVAFYKAPCEPFSRCSVSAYLLSSVKVQCYLQSVVTLASLNNVLNPSVGPHTTCHIPVHRKKKRKKKKKRVSETPHPLCVGCHLHPRETFPALQMSVGNYSGVSNALRQPERRRLAWKREAVWQFFLGILQEIACSWKTVKVSKLGGESLYPFLPPFKNQICWNFPFLSIHHFATPVY